MASYSCRPNSTECDLLGERLLSFVLTGVLTCRPNSTECGLLGERLLTLAVADVLACHPECGLLPTSCSLSEGKLHLLAPWNPLNASCLNLFETCEGGLLGDGGINIGLAQSSSEELSLYSSIDRFFGLGTHNNFGCVEPGRCPFYNLPCRIGDIAK